MEIRQLMTTQQVEMLQHLIEPLVSLFVDRVAERVRQLEEEKEPRYYTRQQVAELLCITLPTLHAFVKRGLLTPQRIGGKVLFDANAIDNAVKTHSVHKHMRKGGAL